MDHWTPKVTARRQLAQLLKAEHLPRAQAAGLTVEDLDVIIAAGLAAEEADKEQGRQLAHIQASISERATAGDDLFDREDQLRARLPAVIGDLRAAGESHAATFLEQLSFARYRFREFAPAARAAAAATDSVAATPEAAATAATADAPVAVSSTEAEAIRKVARVTRADRPGRATGLASLAEVLAGETSVMTQLGRRGIAPDWLTRLASDARAYGEAGRNVRLAAEATDREATEARRQRERWAQARRMIRMAARGVPALESKLAET